MKIAMVCEEYSLNWRISLKISKYSASGSSGRCCHHENPISNSSTLQSELNRRHRRKCWWCLFSYAPTKSRWALSLRINEYHLKVSIVDISRSKCILLPCPVFFRKGILL